MVRRMGSGFIPFAGHVWAAILQDDNIQEVIGWYRNSHQSFGRRAQQYLLEKVPIVSWLPRYTPSWLVNDIVAGLTIGVLLVPQSLAYANIAKLPGAYGLLSSWLPMLIYAIMGTSKDVQTGPVAINALLTAGIVTSLRDKGHTAPEIAAAVSFMCGVYGIAVGLFKLGFLLDFVSAPALAGYISAAGLTICLQQIPNFFAQGEVGHETADIIYNIFSKLPQAKWRDFLIGLTGLLSLAALQWMGQTWGKKYRSIWFLSISRNAIVIILFTGISYALNKDQPDRPLFAISKTTGAVIGTPSMPSSSLLGEVAGGAITVFIAAALEHLAIGKALGRRHGYEIDKSQELLFVGVANFANSFFSSMPVTGGFSRTAVNSESGVKSPLGGLVTSACVLVSIYKLAGTFYWIPKATLSAIIVSAVWAIIVPPRVFYQYWKTSFADFVASMVSFWVTLFVSVEMGIAAAVGYNVIYVLFRMAFTGVTYVGVLNTSSVHADLPAHLTVLEGEETITLRFRIGESILFANAYRIKDEIISHVKSETKGAPKADVPETDRLWNQPRRRTEWAEDREDVDQRPLLRQVTLDMTAVNHVDATGIEALLDLKRELRDYAGHSAMVFVGLNDAVERRFKRASWTLEKMMGPGNGELASGHIQPSPSGLLGGNSKDELSKIEMTTIEHVGSPSSGEEEEEIRSTRS